MNVGYLEAVVQIQVENYGFVLIANPQQMDVALMSQG
jgi:hypothetical protein